ncbi:Adenine phosphoribosyltransferase [Frankliniella fusca]|uniref:Adenine phosphoribosyltransferase n=1 Tax=Frankliniella fusca TaxID=407009 RepID=A0AAE1I5C3_9NEOP|nr:Adenine phosphoribosyltransferase [Frankliniella fusca]
MRCRKFMVVGCQELRKRYDFGVPIMVGLGALSPSIAVSRTDRPPSILPLARAVPRCVAQDEETLQRLEEEWRKFPSLPIPAMKNRELQKNPDCFWHEMRQAADPCGDTWLAVLPSFALAALALPHSNASCERDFSKINNIKTKTRNCLITPTVRATVLASQAVKRGPEETCCHSWAPSTEHRQRMTSAVIYKSTSSISETDILFQ